MKSRTLKIPARSLRRNQTEAEKLLWNRLRSRQLSGVKFRRQQPLGPYIADFCSLEPKLVIELDGGQHAETVEKDNERSKFLKAEEFQVLRVWNNEIFSNLDGVLGSIRLQLEASPSPRPSPLKGEGGGRRKGLAK